VVWGGWGGGGGGSLSPQTPLGTPLVYETMLTNMVGPERPQMTK